jgi:hypothetical protein
MAILVFGFDLFVFVFGDVGVTEYSSGGSLFIGSKPTGAGSADGPCFIVPG